MSYPVYTARVDSNEVFTVGRVGYESGTADDGGVFTGVLHSERICPLGVTGYCKFRRVVLRVHHTSSFTITVKLYVDNVQTKVWSGSSQVDQSVVFTEASPSPRSPVETLLQVDLSAAGTAIEVRIEVDSDDAAGVFLPEEVEVHFYPLRKARQGSAEAS